MNRIFKVIEIKESYNKDVMVVTLLNDMGMKSNIVDRTKKNHGVKPGDLVKVKFYTNLYSTQIESIELYKKAS